MIVLFMYLYYFFYNILHYILFFYNQFISVTLVFILYDLAILYNYHANKAHLIELN